MHALLSEVPQIGRVTWIGRSPARRAHIEPMDVVDIDAHGLVGDHHGAAGDRQVTLVQAEALAFVASLLGRDVAPEHLRRNVLIAGVNLNSLRQRAFRIGPDVVLEWTGLCHPCSRMEETLGRGAFQALRGYGGITARVRQGGRVRRGDELRVLPPVSALAED